MCSTFYYVWDAICSETRFMWLFFSPYRDSISCKSLFNLCPLTEIVVTDGAFSYNKTIRERYSNTHHERCATFESKPNNNLIERGQNTIRRFTHPRRGFNSKLTGGIQLI